MTRNKQIDTQLNYVKWVTADKYSELIGQTKAAINSMRSRGIFRENEHWKKFNGRVYLNIETTQELIDKG